VLKKKKKSVDDPLGFESAFVDMDDSSAAIASVSAVAAAAAGAAQHREVDLVDQYFSYPLNAVPPFADAPNHPLLAWSQLPKTFDPLRQLVFRYVCIPASSAPSEEVFSAAGNTVTDHRSSLGSDTVSDLLMIRFNKDIIPEVRAVYDAEAKRLDDLKNKRAITSSSLAAQTDSVSAAAAAAAVASAGADRSASRANSSAAAASEAADKLNAAVAAAKQINVIPPLNFASLPPLIPSPPPVLPSPAPAAGHHAAAASATSAAAAGDAPAAAVQAAARHRSRHVNSASDSDSDNDTVMTDVNRNRRKRTSDTNENSKAKKAKRSR